MAKVSLYNIPAPELPPCREPGDERRHRRQRRQAQRDVVGDAPDVVGRRRRRRGIPDLVETRRRSRTSRRLEGRRRAPLGEGRKVESRQVQGQQQKQG